MDGNVNVMGNYQILKIPQLLQVETQKIWLNTRCDAS